MNVENVPDTPGSNPPSVSITNSAAGSTVSRTVQVRVNATDDVSLSSVQLYIDGGLKASSNISPLDYSWNTRKASSGDHIIKPMVVDGANHTSETKILVTKGILSGSGGGNRKGKIK